MSAPGEWIEWKGGDCPVPPETVVDFLTKGETPTCHWAAPGPAGDLRWSHIFEGSGGDILAYKVIKS
jgi:hypothetical protein